MNNKQQFIDAYLDNLSEVHSISRDDAFEIFSIASIVQKSFDDVYENIIIRGNEDGGIDGILFEEQGNSYDMLVFQCKNKASLTQKEIDKFRNNFHDVFVDGNVHGLPNISNLEPKIDEYKQISSDGYLIEHKLYFIYNGENEDPTHSNNSHLFRNYHKPLKGFEIWDSNAIYSHISLLIKAQNKRNNIKFVFHPKKSNITSLDNQGLYTYSIENVRAANFRISALELCKLVEEELANNNTYDFLFSDNIRGFLGLRIRPNKRMYGTLKEPSSAVYFPLLNNGVTIICEKLNIPSNTQDGTYLLPTINPVIVNGLQTTRVLFKVYEEDKEKLKNVYVNIRLYETDNEEIIDRITDATNTQTPINYRDKVSNKDFNIFTREYFANRKVIYLAKRGETFSRNLLKKPGITMEYIDSHNVLKYWFASFYEKPEIAKNSISKVLETVYDATNNDHPLNKLFNGDVNSPIYQQLFYAYKFYSHIVHKRKTMIDAGKEFIHHASELLAYGIYKYLEFDIKAVEDGAKLDEGYQFAFKIIDKIVEEDIEKHIQRDKIFSYNGYFKKPKCRIDYNRFAGIIENDNLVEDLLAAK